MLEGCMYGCCQEAWREAETADGQGESNVVIWIVVQHHPSRIASDFPCTAEREQICEEVRSFPDSQTDMDNREAGKARDQEDIDAQIWMVSIYALLHRATWTNCCTAGIEEAYSANHDRVQESEICEQDLKLLPAVS